MNTADGANRYGARATSVAPGTKSIQNSTCRVRGIPGKSSGKTSRNSRTTVRISFPNEMRTSFLAQAITALYHDNQSMPIITSKLSTSTGSRSMLNGWFRKFKFRAASFKVSLSSALIATVALLIIVVVVAVVVVGVVVICNPSSNPTPSTNSNPKGRNRRRSKQRIENFNLEELSPLIVTMADQRTMTQLLQAPTEGYEDAIVVPAITADNFELRHGLLTLVQNEQFFGHDKEDPHAHAPAEGYEDAIVVPAITADNFELKHGLLTLVQNKQFFGHDKKDPHAHVRYFNKITSTLKFPNVPNTSIKLMLFPFSLEGATQIWLEKEPP
nr:reverse transcriptase domain-containing protein [Tanacetum cinerariifolium]